MAQKRVQHIPENSNPIQEKFVNYIMKDGKKSTARQIFKDMLAFIEKKGNKNPMEIFEKALEKAKPIMEVRPRRIGGAVYQIPVEVKPHRQMSLSFRWILAAARGKKGQEMAKKLADELIDASNEQGAAIKKRDDTHRMAQSNKAFAHLAKYQGVK
jgi:small subunit ribosomal protein S7